MVARPVYKICSRAEWDAALYVGRFEGSAADRRDGFIHLSDRSQVVETAARHFSGQHGLVLVAFDAEALGPALRWEPSRQGALFPHHYGPLPAAAARWVEPLPLDRAGDHRFPARFAHDRMR
jgi:uncharacterized protein (DUF952 family)